MNMEFTLNGTGFTEEIVCLFTRSVKSKTNILIKLLLTRVTFIHNVLYRNYQSQLNVVILVPDLIWTFTSRILLVLPRNGAFLPISSPTQPLTHKCTDSLCFFQMPTGILILVLYQIVFPRRRPWLMCPSVSLSEPDKCCGFLQQLNNIPTMTRLHAASISGLKDLRRHSSECGTDTCGSQMPASFRLPIGCQFTSWCQKNKILNSESLDLGNCFAASSHVKMFSCLVDVKTWHVLMTLE